jgi:O-antigen ligase
MTILKPPQPIKTTVLVTVVAIWTCAVSCAAVKLAVPHFEWWVTAVFLVCVLPLAPRTIWGRLRYTLTWGALLSFGIALVAINASDPGYQLLQGGKLAVILVIVLPLLAGSDQMARATVIGAKLACYINTALLILGLCGITWAGGLQALDRYGTILNPPGSLWRVGLMTLAIGPLSLVTKTSSRPRAILLTGCSLLLLAFDGSRTGTLILFMLGGFLLWALLVRPWAPLSAFRRPALVALLGIMIPLLTLATSAVGRSGMTDVLQRLGMTRIIPVLGGDRDDSGLLEADRFRSQMWHDAIDQIKSSPVIGVGMGTTQSATGGMISQTPGVPAMTVHMSYLQVWADAGILAAASYFMLVVGTLLHNVKRLRNACSPETWVAIAGGVFLLSAIAVAGVFHPLSTELSEWVAFIVAVGGAGFSGFTAPKQVLARYV